MDNIKFIVDIHPFNKNMENFGNEWDFTFGDGKKDTPRFCEYKKSKNVYLDDHIISELSQRRANKLNSTEKEQKNELMRYIKKNFMDGLDPPLADGEDLSMSISSLSLSRPDLVRQESIG